MFDFVVAGIGLVCLAVALWGLVIAAQASFVILAIAKDCAYNQCTHSGTLVAVQEFTVSSKGPAPIRYCILTLDLDVGRQRAAVPDPRCGYLHVPSEASADLWHGTLVSVRTADGKFGTYANPSNGLPGGLFRTVALLPFVLCVAIVHYDLVHHPVFQSVHRRMRGLSP